MVHARVILALGALAASMIGLAGTAGAAPAVTLACPASLKADAVGICTATITNADPQPARHTLNFRATGAGFVGGVRASDVTAATCVTVGERSQCTLNGLAPGAQTTVEAAVIGSPVLIAPRLGASSSPMSIIVDDTLDPGSSGLTGAQIVVRHPRFAARPKARGPCARCRAGG